MAREIGHAETRHQPVLDSTDVGRRFAKLPGDLSLGESGEDAGNAQLAPEILEKPRGEPTGLAYRRSSICHAPMLRLR